MDLRLELQMCGNKNTPLQNSNSFKTAQQFYTKFSAVVKNGVDRPSPVQYYKILRK